MKKIFLSINSLLIAGMNYCQTPYSIKEQYDLLDVNHNIISTNYLDPTISYTNCEGLSVRLGDKVSFVLMSQI